MATFPALKTGVVGMYPAVLGVQYATETVQFVNDTEQRWAGNPGLGNFELTFTDIDGYDLSTLVEFFRSCKGQFDTTWTLTMNGQTLNYCTFLSDEIVWQENKPERYTLTLKCRQVRK